MSGKFPVSIIVNGKKFSAATSIEKLKERGRNIRLELNGVELDYTVLVKTTRDILCMAAESKDPRLYWLTGDAILRFLERLDEMGFYLHRQNGTLARDIGVSESSLGKVLSFRRRFAILSMIDPSVSWSKYRDGALSAGARVKG